VGALLSRLARRAFLIVVFNGIGRNLENRSPLAADAVPLTIDVVKIQQLRSANRQTEGGISGQYRAGDTALK
jgi:hypothetical protein